MSTQTVATGRGVLPHRTRGSLFGHGRSASREVITTAQPRGRSLAGEADGERGFTLAMRLAGERALPVDRGLALLSPQSAVPASAGLRRHRVRQDRDTAAVGLGHGEGERRSGVLPGRQGRPGDRRPVLRADERTPDVRPRVFPNEPFDGWRGQAHEIHGRLMEIIDYTSEGPAAWYRDVAKNVLRLVCEHPEGHHAQAQRHWRGWTRTCSPRRTKAQARLPL